MKRRSFVKTSLLAAALGGIAPLPARSEPDESSKKDPPQEFYELRVYTLKTEAQGRMVEDYFEKAAIPALNRLGSKNIGVFRDMKPEGQPRVFVLIPFRSVDDFIKSGDKLLKDATYQSSASVYLDAPAAEPAYDRIESSFLKAFRHLPKVEPPEKKQRIFELRRYEAATENALRKKIEMFNDAGEIDIFRRTGLTPVFFGETLVGPMRPNLTYLLTYDDMDERDRNWKVFGSDPEWKIISAKPEYANAKIVSRITSTFLVPAAFSQI
ncbi:MAG TPA: NIPSNAP family protein [Chitinophagaceae bacterium]|nr:NIPSNAP family protein [Chitinophagaceae bacterium]